MSLISKEDLINVSGLSKLGFVKNPIAKSVMKLTKIDKVNELYDKLKDKTGKDFFDSFVRERDLQYIIFARSSSKIMY